MKFLSLLSLILCLSFTSLSAQSNYEAENEGWLISLEEAYAESKKTGKPIMANFTGSDWCGWCKKLTRDVFNKQEFQTWADKNVVLLELDFPRRKKIPNEIRQQNAGLQQAFKVRGYPSVWIFDLDKGADGKFNIDAKGKTGYAKSPNQFIDASEKIMANGK